MSHLIHVLDYKKYLTEQGITCPVEQSAILVEPFTRALIRHAYRTGGQWTPAVDAKAWTMLEKWNSVSPINAPLIHQKALWRMNNLNGAMAQTGTLPKAEEYTCVIGDKDVTQNEQFNTLVVYLLKELEAGRE